MCVFACVFACVCVFARVVVCVLLITVGTINILPNTSIHTTITQQRASGTKAEVRHWSGGMRVYVCMRCQGCICIRCVILFFTILLFKRKAEPRSEVSSTFSSHRVHPARSSQKQCDPRCTSYGGVNKCLVRRVCLQCFITVSRRGRESDAGPQTVRDNWDGSSVRHTLA